MVNLEAFEIGLDRPDSIYLAGDTVGGIIYISVTPKQRIKVKDLSVTLSGEAKTNWINKVSDNIYDTVEPYINEKQSLKSYLANFYDERGVLGIGTHRITFKFVLPSNLPSSYESEFGYVRYTCQAEVQITSADLQRSVSFRNGFSSRNKTISVQKPVRVIAQVDARQLTPNGMNGPLKKEDGIEMAGCCGVRVGYVNAAISVPRSVFVIGQAILVEVWMENHSKHRLPSSIYINLVQEIHFRSVSYFQTACDTKTTSRILHTVQLDTPDRGEALTKRALLQIPPNAAASSVTNTIITVQYKLRLQVGQMFDIVLPIGVATKM